MKLRNLIFLLVFPFVFSFCSNGEVKIEFNHPLQANETAIGEWKWMDVDGMICRDSSATGIGVRLGTNSKKWMIYLQGGGACFTPETCATNLSNYGADNFISSSNAGYYNRGIMNNEKEENPIKDWNVVYVPYCTGDVHSGNLENGFPLGGTEPQQFVGNRNIRLLLEYLKPYMEKNEVDEIMITGISAGGFGTHITYFETKKLFPNVKTHVINDSGPLVSDPQILTFCMGIGIQLMYNLAVPPGFIFCCEPTYGLADIYTLSARNSANDNFGLISYTEDNTIRYFFAAGQNTCTGGEISGEDFKNGLIHLRENVLKPTEKWSTYFVSGTGHTFLYTDAGFYNTIAEEKLLYNWIREVMNGEVQHIYE
jgi:hypothetical protein